MSNDCDQDPFPLSKIDRAIDWKHTVHIVCHVLLLDPDLYNSYSLNYTPVIYIDQINSLISQWASLHWCNWSFSGYVQIRYIHLGCIHVSFLTCIQHYFICIASLHGYCSLIWPKQIGQFHWYTSWTQFAGLCHGGIYDRWVQWTRLACATLWSWWKWNSWI